MRVDLDHQNGQRTPPPVGPPPAPGSVVAGRFEVGDLLGSGGQAAVYRARDRLLGREVALKVFDPASDLGTADTVLNEMRTLAGLEHPGIVTVYDVGTTAGRPYLVMRLVDRGSLADLLADGPLDVPQATVLAAALCAALAYVHSRGLVHRDLKPANVLLATDPTAGAMVPLLADFGTASLTAAITAGGERSLVGTPAYLAPEQVADHTGSAIGPAADVYALGLVVLEALTGRREFGGLPSQAAVARLHREPVIPLELPAELQALLAAMTARDPARRPTPTQAGAVVRRLAEALDDPPTTQYADRGVGLVLPGAPADRAGGVTDVERQQGPYRPALPDADVPVAEPTGRPRGLGRRRALLAVGVAAALAGAAVTVTGLDLSSTPTSAQQPLAAAPTSPPAVPLAARPMPSTPVASPTASPTPQADPDTPDVVTPPAHGKDHRHPAHRRPCPVHPGLCR